MGAKRQGDRRYYYKCHGRKNLRNGCRQKAFRKDTLEKFVLDAILEKLKKPHNIERITKGLLALQESQIKTSSTLGILEKERKQNESAIENIMSAVEHGFYTATASKRMRELEERQSELDRLIIIERSKMQVKVSAEEIRTFYEAALMQEPQMLINYLVKEIIVYDDKIHIYFNSPLQTSLDDSQGFSLCDKEEKIPVHVQNSLEMRLKTIRLTITI